mmetsp:Transcript_15473/g.48374  ORF Transcript_15473/g.48374 Transcript_15473/m.48374 type:complete len:358 (+) Transcript_15473:1214-2287(+)
MLGRRVRLRRVPRQGVRPLLLVPGVRTRRVRKSHGDLVCPVHCVSLGMRARLRFSPTMNARVCRCLALQVNKQDQRAATPCWRMRAARLSLHSPSCRVTGTSTSSTRSASATGRRFFRRDERPPASLSFLRRRDADVSNAVPGAGSLAVAPAASALASPARGVPPGGGGGVSYIPTGGVTTARLPADADPMLVGIVYSLSSVSALTLSGNVYSPSSTSTEVAASVRPDGMVYSPPSSSATSVISTAAPSALAAPPRFRRRDEAVRRIFPSFTGGAAYSPVNVRFALAVVPRDGLAALSVAADAVPARVAAASMVASNVGSVACDSISSCSTSPATDQRDSSSSTMAFMDGRSDGSRA